MNESWRLRRDRVETLAARAEAARDLQRSLASRLQHGAWRWLGQAETLAWFGVTGFVWGARVHDNRQADDDLKPVRELAGAAWLVLSWRRLPGRVRRLIRKFDPAGTPSPRSGAAPRVGPGSGR